MSQPHPTNLTYVAEFLAGIPFQPDRFQRDAIEAFAAGHSVVVTAPTGAGKTLVAEAAVDLAKRGAKRSFYTTPIKALSNQKFADFRRVYGESEVGLLTGDNVINGSAPVVVMTTEVLRNMIYADSTALDGLGVVILDEVHYLQDPQRGSVWEEVIIHLPRHVPVVALSATVSNAAEFTDWIAARRGATKLIIEEHRPVPLSSEYMIKDRHREGALELFPVFDRKGTRPNPAVMRLLKKSRGRHRRFATPRRVEVVEELARRDLVPLIYFIFSRAGVDQGAQLVAEAGLGLTTTEERAEIRAVAEARTAHLSPQDLGVLGYGLWVANLEQGVAPHHAGMVPAFKETVEELFQVGLVRVVFATETLALGINMPARAVVLERLTKFTGDGHEMLRPGDYTQLTGRAGRRGIDAAGTAVVLYDSYVPFDRVAAIAAAGSHPLKSSFRPTYNMTVNLVANYERRRAEELLRASFAQFREERRLDRIAARADKLRAEIQELRATAASDFGDVWEYAATMTDMRSVLRDFAQSTEPGDVLRLTSQPDDLWVLLARGYGVNPRLLLVNRHGEIRKLSADGLSMEVARVGVVALADPIRSRETRYQRYAARLLEQFEPDGDESSPGRGAPDHPVVADPGLTAKLDVVKRVKRLERDLRKLERRTKEAAPGLVADFQRRLDLLEDRGYTKDWNLTPAGERLRFVYSELDLLIAESIEAGMLTGLDAPSLAAVATLFIYEARLEDRVGVWPTSNVAARGEAILDLADGLAAAESRHRIEPSRLPDPGFAAIGYDWAQGASLEDLFEDDEIGAGDFVRTMRQLLDLLRQLRDAYPEVAEAARGAIELVDRGVVAAGGQV